MSGLKNKTCLIGVGKFGFSALKHLSDVTEIADMYFVALSKTELAMYYVEKRSDIGLIENEAIKSRDYNEASEIMSNYTHVVTISDVDNVDAVIVDRRIVEHVTHSCKQAFHCVMDDKDDDSHNLKVSLLDIGASTIRIKSDKTIANNKMKHFYASVKSALVDIHEDKY